MSSNAMFYSERAAAARAEAAAALLANVRERCLRSAAAWQVMAERAARSDRLRAEELARKTLAQLT